MLSGRHLSESQRGHSRGTGQRASTPSSSAWARADFLNQRVPLVAPRALASPTQRLVAAGATDMDGVRTGHADDGTPARRRTVRDGELLAGVGDGLVSRLVGLVLLVALRANRYRRRLRLTLDHREDHLALLRIVSWRRLDEHR